MRELLKRFFAYILSISIVTIIIVYILNLPEFITGETMLVKEYYYDNALYSFILDIFLVAFYISIAMFVGRLFHINQKDNSQQLLILALTTLIISGVFMIYFINGGSPETFFYRWFKKVGYKALIYDVILVCSIYIVMMIIYNSNIFKRVLNIM